MLALKLNIRCTSFRKQRDKPPISYLFSITICLSLREKDGLFLSSFFLFSFFFLHDGVNRWPGKVLPTFAQTNEKKKRKAPRFRPRKRSQSIIIYSHCIAQDHSHTHTHVHILKTTLDLWDYKIKVWKTNMIVICIFFPNRSYFARYLDFLQEDKQT